MSRGVYLWRPTAEESPQVSTEAFPVVRDDLFGMVGQPVQLAVQVSQACLVLHNVWIHTGRM